MLCSHSHKFIFLKTKKTASTSLEIFFERYCRPPGYDIGFSSDEYIGPTGIIGQRSSGGFSKGIFHSHMPAHAVMDNVNTDIWNNYYKFTSIRNPYDKAVSAFWYHYSKDLALYRKIKTYTLDELRQEFKKFILQPIVYSVLQDDEIFLINDQPIVNKFIRYENLFRDLDQVCKDLHIDLPVDQLGNYRSEHRSKEFDYQEYYDEESKLAVSKNFSWQIDYFSYKF